MMHTPQSFPQSSAAFLLASPPDLPLDRFSPVLLRIQDKMSIAAATNPVPSLLSPPESPETSHVALRRASPLVRPSHGGLLMPDEPLLPEDGASISLETPLFSVAEKHEPLIEKVALQRSSEAPGRPSPQEYGLFVSSAWRLCQNNPVEWLRKEKQFQSMYRINKATPAKRTTMAAAAIPRVRPAGAQQRTARAPRATPKLLARDDFDRQLFTPPRSSADGTPAPTRQRLTAPTREDSNFEALPDLTPPLDSLPSHNRALLTDWRGNPLTIENEPHFDKLHPAEAKLASTLRLTPAIYLSSKRRIFIEKVRRTQIGKEFRKTDSQKACKIDVNKASKLWTAFDKVGWFERRWIDPHMDKEITIEP